MSHPRAFAAGEGVSVPAPTVLRTAEALAYPRPRLLASRAVRALVDEALLTPKPGLVDRRGSGAHRDLDLGRLLRSAAALQKGFEHMAACARAHPPTRALRGAIGREAEVCMLSAAGGSNTHRGAIWIVGLLVAGLAMCEERAPAAEVAATAAAIARLPDRLAPALATHGSRVCVRYGVDGARGEARAGFPHVILIGLPALRSARTRGASETAAQLDALMAIMASLEDTCLLHRGGRSALRAAQTGAQAVLENGGSSSAEGHRRLLALDAELKKRWVSPGGSADLLAACLLLDRAAHGVEEMTWKS